MSGKNKFCVGLTGFFFVLLFLLLLTISSLANVSVPQMPETAGSLCSTSDADFEEFRYDEQIPYCKRNVSTYTKKQIYEAYGVPTDTTRDYTIDHIIPLSIGGSNQLDNLWPEHKSIKNCRKDLEINTYKELRSGLITQEEAVSKILYVKLKTVCIK